MTTPNNKEEKPRCFDPAHHIAECRCFSLTPDSMEKCHCQRTSRYDTIDSIYKNHSIDRCWTDPTPTDSWENRFDRLFTNEIEYDLITREYVKIKSFISQVRQKAYDEGYEKGRDHGYEVASGERHWE